MNPYFLILVQPKKKKYIPFYPRIKRNIFSSEILKTENVRCRGQELFTESFKAPEGPRLSKCPTKASRGAVNESKRQNVYARLD